MADDMRNPVTGTVMGASGGPRPAIKGARAGESFAGGEDLARAAAEKEFLAMHPEWQGLGAAKNRPANYKQLFEDFYASKKKGVPGTAPPAQNAPMPTATPPPTAPPPTGGIGNAGRRGALNPADLASPLTGENQPRLTAQDLGPSPLQDVDTETLMRILRG